MQKKPSVSIVRSPKNINQEISERRNGMLGPMIALALATLTTGNVNASEQNTNKIAEMTALVRHSENCPQVPNELSAAYLMLLMMAPPTEKQVEELEHKMLALREKIGTAKWCQLYAVEMEEAYLIIKRVTRR